MSTKVSAQIGEPIWEIFREKGADIPFHSNIKCGDKYLYTFTYVQYNQNYTKFFPHT